MGSQISTGVQGVTGSGKSSFIKTSNRRKPRVVRDDMPSHYPSRYDQQLLKDLLRNDNGPQAWAVFLQRFTAHDQICNLELEVSRIQSLHSRRFYLGSQLPMKSFFQNEGRVPLYGCNLSKKQRQQLQQWKWAKNGLDFCKEWDVIYISRYHAKREQIFHLFLDLYWEPELDIETIWAPLLELKQLEQLCAESVSRVRGSIDETDRLNWCREQRRQYRVYAKQIRSRTQIVQKVAHRSKRAYVVHGTLGNTEIAAMPDTGSQLNIISEAHIRAMNVSIDTSDTPEVQIASGCHVKTLGSVLLPWTYAGENQTHMITCHVLRNCPQKLILGNTFLGRGFMKRVKVTYQPTSQPVSVNLLGSEEQRIAGHLENAPAVALPDMGSDLCILSADYAKSRGFNIDTSHDKRVEVELANGSRTYTHGVIENLTWTFGQGERTATAQASFYIIKDLPVDIILSNDLLFDSNAFDEYEESFFCLETKVTLLSKKKPLEVYAIKFLHAVCEIFKKQPHSHHQQEESKPVEQEQRYGPKVSTKPTTLLPRHIALRSMLSRGVSQSPAERSLDSTDTSSGPSSTNSTGLRSSIASSNNRASAADGSVPPTNGSLGPALSALFTAALQP